jgi:hypothetical protein
MNNRLIASVLLVITCIFLSADISIARGGSGKSSSRETSSSHASGKSRASSSRNSNGTISPRAHHGGKKKADGVKRDKNGKIARSEKAKHDFMRQNPCPSTGKTSGACPGYTVDHITPLKRGGKDDPSNMQWQTKADARAKDKWE